MFKSFRFWFTLFAAIVVIYNITGKDDKNLVLFFSTPPFWVMEGIRMPIPVIYLLALAFWFLFGWAIDYGVSKLKRT